MTRTDVVPTDVIAGALRTLSEIVDSDDGVASAAIYQAAVRLEEQAEEIQQLQAEVEALRNLLRHAQPIIKSHAGASHMIEGFRPKRNQWDELAETIDAAIQEENK